MPSASGAFLCWEGLSFILRPSPFFSFSVECVSWYWVGRSDWKKKKLKKNHKKSRNRRPWYPRTTLKVNIHIFGLTKYTIYCKKFSCFCFCFSLCCYYKYSFFSLQQFLQLKNGLTTSSFLLFLKMAKSWVGRTTVNGEKKRGWANYKKKKNKKKSSINSG